MEWSQIADDFETDGSLRDIYVLGTTLADWDAVLARLRRLVPPPIFTIDDVVQEMPAQTALIFSIRDKHSPLLAIMLGMAQLNCNFFQEDEIEFDLDPQEITSASQAETVAGFMESLGEATQKPVILCYENTQHAVIARCSPETGKVVWIGTREE
jgi:hypothetical protein